MRKLLLSLTITAFISVPNWTYASFVPSAPVGVATVEIEPSKAAVDSAVEQFKSLSNSEKKSKLREMKKAISAYKADKKAGKDVDSNTILQVILALFLPPLAVYLHEGSTNNKFWISVLLTILGLLIFGFAGILFLGTLPSIVYALVVILSN
jgi:uncharacterized membrane protein YqaE (UPF0057 family)